MIPYETIALGTAPHAISLCTLDARGVRLHADAHLESEIETLLVRQPELFGELVDPDLCSQIPSDQPFVVLLDAPHARVGAKRDPLSSRSRGYRHEQG